MSNASYSSRMPAKSSPILTSKYVTATTSYRRRSQRSLRKIRETQMSRFDDHRVQSDPAETLEREKAGPNRAVEIGSRFGMSKEAARVEMDRFRGVAEYETRKIFGQHSALKQSIAPEPSRPRTGRRNAENHTATVRQVPEEPATLTAPVAEESTQQLEIFERTPEVGE